MVERTAAILIDAGYLWKQMAKAVGKNHRKEIPLLGYGVPLIEALVEEAEGDGMAVLRTYWYDGAPDRVPNVQQRAVGRAGRVKLRLGSMSGGRQKGVDRLLQRDILALAENKAVTDLVILTGDQDMEEEIDAAGQHGLLIHLWGIADQDQQDQISGRLLRIVDDWKVLPAHWAETFVPEETGNVGETVASVPLTSDSQLDAFRQHVLGAPAAAVVNESTVESGLWGGLQLQEVGRAAYDTLKEQYGAEWESLRDGMREKTWRGANGEAFRSIPGRYDTELIDAAEGIVALPLSEAVQRRQVRIGFWTRFDEDDANEAEQSTPLGGYDI